MSPIASGIKRIMQTVPAETLRWLLEPDNPAVAVLTRRRLLGEEDSPALTELWARRNEYAPVARILELQTTDGSWAPPARDYQKYWGSLWQIHFLGELMANPDDERIRRGAEYAFSRQLPDGAWSCNGRPVAAIPCLTANVGRALARLGYARDERVIRALASIADIVREYGVLACTAGGHSHTLNGYCHMLAPKVLLFLGEMPRDVWPDGAEELRAECVRVLRERQIFRCLPAGYREFQDLAVHAPLAERPELRERWIAEHGPLQYGDKPGWLRFGYPLSYNSDALEALAALAGVGEERRPEYEAAIETVRSAADPQMRWIQRTSFDDKMLACVSGKGELSKWLTLRALEVLGRFGE
ncbi:MAG: terpene cyclase/mutase family protein [Coriobacteriia bacterium]|nr:terpene cyclase/mutase family protein [Coriobacteriia bacterium]